MKNNPVRYTDPSGHCIASNGNIKNEYPFGTSGFCSDYTPTRLTAGQIPKSTIPEGVKTWDAIVAWRAMEEIGIANDVQGAMDYLVANEFTQEQINNPDQSSQYQLYAIARRYYQYCSDNPMGAECVQSFWAYIQGTVRYFDDPDSYIGKQNEVTASISNAILNPGTVAFTISRDYNPTDVMITQSMANEGCSTNGLCEWALFPSTWIDTILANKEFSSGPYGNTTYWSRIEFTSDGTTFKEAIYIFDFGKEYLIIMDRSSKSNMCSALGTCY